MSGNQNQLSFHYPEGRWKGFGPYYAMFPVDFAYNIIQKYTKERDCTLDPFSGRGTTAYVSSILNRKSVGIEINPLGWVYSEVKLSPASQASTLKRIAEIDKLSQTEIYKNSYKEYGEFFQLCYSKRVLNFLHTARAELKFKTSKTDKTVMGFILIHLHGKYGQSLSNQMQSVKACGMNYAVKWWKEKSLIAPEIDPVELLTKKLEWRYAKGKLISKDCKIYLGDSTEILKHKKIQDKKFNLLLTSPPYMGVTDYFYDQWLRLWMLGGLPEQKKRSQDNQNAFANKEKYKTLLNSVFSLSKKSLSEDAVVYVRTDAREFTKENTIQTLRNLFPEKKMSIIKQRYTKRTQTSLHGDSSKKPGEIDIILTP